MYLFLLFAGLLFLVFYGGMHEAPFAPTRKKDVHNFTSLAKIKEGDRVVDLGCGDGRLLFACASRGAFVHGYEIALVPYLIVLWRRMFSKDRERIKITYGSFWKADLGGADVIYFFLMPEAYKRVREKIEQEVKEGTRVACYAWPVKEWELAGKKKEKNSLGTYLYQF